MPGLREQLARGGGRLRAMLAPCMAPLRWLARIGLLVIVSAGAVAGGRLLEQYVRSASAFATRELRVSGFARLSQADVLSTAGLAEGKNIFEVSPDRARAALLEHPWIAEAKVTRRLPGSYALEIREHQAALAIALETLYLVSEEGTIFKGVEASDAIDLPILTGIDPARFRADLGLRTALLINAVALLHDYRDAGLWRREPIAEIHAASADNFVLYVGDDALQVRLGPRPFAKKLRRLRAVLDRLHKDAARPAYVYLDNVRRPDRVAVGVR